MRLRVAKKVTKRWIYVRMGTLERAFRIVSRRRAEPWKGALLVAARNFDQLILIVEKSP